MYSTQFDIRSQVTSSLSIYLLFFFFLHKTVDLNYNLHSQVCCDILTKTGLILRLGKSMQSVRLAKEAPISRLLISRIVFLYLCKFVL